VVPAAHYSAAACDDLHGRTDIQRLFGLWGVRGNGLHGANRLASNSLIEALVFSHSAVQRASTAYNRETEAPDRHPKWDPGKAQEPDEGVSSPTTGGDPPDDVELVGMCDRTSGCRARSTGSSC